MPIIKGTSSISPIYKGADKIGKIYKGLDLVYQSGPELPVMQAYVKRVKTTNYEGPAYDNGNYIWIGISNLSSEEIITVEYGGVIKTFSSNGSCVFGEISGVDDGTPSEGWVTVKSNIVDSTANIKFSSAYSYDAQAYASYCCLANNIIKGNYVFASMMSYKYNNHYGSVIDSLIFETAKRYAGYIFNSSSHASISSGAPIVTTVTLGKNTEYIADYAFGDGAGGTDLQSITFADTTNKKIDIQPNAFKVKTASDVNVYTYGNESVLNYDWATANSGAIINNLGRQ